MIKINGKIVKTRIQESKKPVKVTPHKKLKESSYDKDWDKVEEIKEAMGADEFLMEVLRSMNINEFNETIDYISSLYDIGYDEENDE